MEIKREVIVKHSGRTFSAVYNAEQQLRKEGYSVGVMCGDEPIGFADAKQYGHIAKWKNLSADDRTKLDGVITSTDWREGDVKITYYQK